MPRAKRREGDRGIRQLGPDLWEVNVSGGIDPAATALQGRPVYRRKYRRVPGTLTAARRARAALEAEVREGPKVSKAATLNQLFDAWLVELERIGRAPKTIRGYRDDAGHYWRPTLGKTPVAEITVRAVDGVLGGLTDRGLSATTVHHVHACISAAFSQAMRWEWIDKDPTKLVRRPSKRNTRPVVPTPDEVRRLLAGARASTRPEMERLIWLGAITGARNSELRALRLSDLDLEQGWMGVERAISDGRVWETKNRRLRDVGLDTATVAVVATQVAFMRDRAAEGGAALVDDAYLFSDSLNGITHWREETVTRFFSQLADELGCGHLTFKHLRKFMDTYGQEAGFSDTTVALRAGHDPSVARKHYTGQIAATDLALSTALAELIGPP